MRESECSSLLRRRRANIVSARDSTAFAFEALDRCGHTRASMALRWRPQRRAGGRAGSAASSGLDQGGGNEPRRSEPRPAHRQDTRVLPRRRLRQAPLPVPRRPGDDWRAGAPGRGARTLFLRTRNGQRERLTTATCASDQEHPVVVPHVMRPTLRVHGVSDVREGASLKDPASAVRDMCDPLDNRTRTKDGQSGSLSKHPRTRSRLPSLDGTRSWPSPSPSCLAAPP